MFFIPLLAAAASGTPILSQISFWAFIVPAIVISIAGLFTIRAQWTNSWRTAAEGYKAEVEAISAAMIRMEETYKTRIEAMEQVITSMQSKIADLEGRPDMKLVVETINTLRDEIKASEARRPDTALLLELINQLRNDAEVRQNMIIAGQADIVARIETQ